MKKYFFFITSLLICCQLANAQKIEVSELKNEVFKIQTSSEKLEIKDDFEYCLVKYISNGKEEFYIMGCFDVNSIHSFPPSAKILFKLFDGSLMDVVSLTSKIINIHKNKYVPTIYYPISEEQLVSLFSGIKKIRIELLSVDKEGTPFVDYQDIEFKKDKVGKNLQKMHESIVKYETKNNNIITKKLNSSTRKNIFEGF